LAVPHFVIDSPGGGGKVPLLPEYVEEITDDEVIFRNYEGQRFVYKQPRAAACATRSDGADVVPIEVGASVKTAARRATRRRSVAG
jgi:lysine 2,3-aminomutase